MKKEKGLVIRRAKKNDWDAMQQFIISNPKGLETRRKYMPKRKHYLVVTMDGVVSGVIAVAPAYELRTHLVAPALRGRGIGDKLVVAAMKWAQEMSLRQLILTTDPKMVSYYKRHGFGFDRAGMSVMVAEITSIRKKQK